MKAEEFCRLRKQYSLPYADQKVILEGCFSSSIESVRRNPDTYFDDEKAKKVKVNHGAGDSGKSKTAKPRTVVVSDEKKELFSEIFGNLTEIYGENAKIEKENKLIIVKIADRTFKIDIIEQRKPKK